HRRGASARRHALPVLTGRHDQRRRAACRQARDAAGHARDAAAGSVAGRGLAAATAGLSLLTARAPRPIVGIGVLRAPPRQTSVSLQRLQRGSPALTAITGAGASGGPTVCATSVPSMDDRRRRNGAVGVDPTST